LSLILVSVLIIIFLLYLLYKNTKTVVVVTPSTPSSTVNTSYATPYSSSPNYSIYSTNVTSEQRFLVMPYSRYALFVEPINTPEPANTPRLAFVATSIQPQPYQSSQPQLYITVYVSMTGQIDSTAIRIIDAMPISGPTPVLTSETMQNYYGYPYIIIVTSGPITAYFSGGY